MTDDETESHNIDSKKQDKIDLAERNVHGSQINQQDGLVVWMNHRSLKSFECLDRPPL